jgi:hypothetical protein
MCIMVNFYSVETSPKQWKLLYLSIANHVYKWYFVALPNSFNKLHHMMPVCETVQKLLYFSKFDDWKVHEMQQCSVWRLPYQLFEGSCFAIGIPLLIVGSLIAYLQYDNGNPLPYLPLIYSISFTSIPSISSSCHLLCPNIVDTILV